MELDAGPRQAEEVVRLELRHRQLGVHLPFGRQHVTHVRVAHLQRDTRPEHSSDRRIGFTQSDS